MTTDRRDALRVSESRLITEISAEIPFAASVVNISGTGVYAVKPVSSGLRGPQKVQLEIPLPEASETVWATGEVMFEAKGRRSIGSGIRFVDMADFHRRLIGDLIEHRRQEIIGRMLREIMWRKELCAHPSPFAASPPHVGDRTVRMYLLPELR